MNLSELQLKRNRKYSLLSGACMENEIMARDNILKVLKYFTFVSF